MSMNDDTKKLIAPWGPEGELWPNVKLLGPLTQRRQGARRRLAKKNYNLLGKAHARRGYPCQQIARQARVAVTCRHTYAPAKPMVSRLYPESTEPTKPTAATPPPTLSDSPSIGTLIRTSSRPSPQKSYHEKGCSESELRVAGRLGCRSHSQTLTLSFQTRS